MMQASARRSSRRSFLSPALWIPAGLALALLGLPLMALVVRAPWAQLPELLRQPTVASALGLSLGTALLSTAISLVLGIPLALVLARSDQWPAVPRRLLRALVTVPLVLPPVVGGVALLLLLGRNGLIGQFLPFQLPFTTAAVVIAQVFVAMPFLVLAVDGALRASDRRFEVAAATLGASRFTVFRRITLPLVAPGVAAGALLCFCRALGEFGATITFAGSFPGVTQTLPIATYLQLQTDPDAAIALSLVLMVISATALVSLRDRWVPGVTA
ncbi:ABC transporter permease [Salinibacterium sp. G-O1]|uniref:ABC transporter permease n=1 Tax=Salinibacterium sp. G-O1 TaxID=3046208 RepID=UPI0024BB1A85|nr:ABC transporter permease [Salinibacterium sp. G-O1]MDJ0335838.1 ABC transporter permease [Salinibacterium sp. G-O1]